ncbi:MAG: helix-turn-helix transcriptional regulator [Actinomycetota bacterium]
MELAEALRRFKAENDLSQEQLADIAGVDQSTISRALEGNFGRKGWPAAMKILGLEKVLRAADGSYSTPEFTDVLEMLGNQMAEESKTGSAERVAEISEIEETIARIERLSR